MRPQPPLYARRLACGNGRIRNDRRPRRVLRTLPGRGRPDESRTDVTKRTCSVPGCERQQKARDWCRTHYDRWRKTGDAGDALIRDYRRFICLVDGCDRPHLARGYCNAHYHRVAKNGAPGGASISIKDPSRLCSVDGCGIKAVGHGMCRTHWARNRKTGTPGTGYIKHLTDPTARNEAGEKRCPSCETWRPLSDFTKCASTPDGLYKRCRVCTRAAILLKSYRMTLEAYEALLDSQGGGCRICSTRPSAPYSLHVDHDHSCCSGRSTSCGQCVRGLLCSSCNTALGLLADDPIRLRSAVEYLEGGRG